jgi:hypothetical protein
MISLWSSYVETQTERENSNDMESYRKTFGKSSKSGLVMLGLFTVYKERAGFDS